METLLCAFLVNDIPKSQSQMKIVITRTKAFPLPISVWPRVETIQRRHTYQHIQCILCQVSVNVRPEFRKLDEQTTLMLSLIIRSRESVWLRLLFTHPFLIHTSHLSRDNPVEHRVWRASLDLYHTLQCIPLSWIISMPGQTAICYVVCHLPRLVFPPFSFRFCPFTFASLKWFVL